MGNIKQLEEKVSSLEKRISSLESRVSENSVESDTKDKKLSVK